MKTKIFFIMIGLILLSLTFVSASFGYNNRDLIIIRTLNDTLDPLWSGNYTNMLTVCPAGNYSYGIFEDGTLKCRDDEGAGADTNETTRFNALVGTDCSGTDKVTGVLDDGTIVCEADEDDDTTYSDLSEFNDDILWTSIFNTTGDTRWLTSFTELDPKWSANFTNMITNCPAGNYSYGMFENGTWKCRSDTTGAGDETDPYWTGNYSAYNTSWSTDTWDTTWVANWTAYNSSWSAGADTNETARFDNLTGTDCSANYLVIGVYDNGTVKCAADTGGAESDPKWSANFTNMITNCPIGNYSYGMFDNGTFKCRSDTTGAGDEVDPKWSANYTAYNESWSQDTTYSQGTNMSFDGTTINWNGAWSLSVFAKISQLASYVPWTTLWEQVYNETEIDTFLATKVAWSDLWNQVYNETEVDAINTSMKNYVDSQDVVYNDSMKAYVDAIGGGPETDPYWSENYTLYNESWSLDTWDTSWLSNWTAYNITWGTDTTYSDLSEFNDDILWTSVFNSTGNTLWTTETYVNLQNTSMKNYVDGEFVSIEVDPLWSANWTNVAFTNTNEVFTQNITVEGILLEVDSANHRIYDNATCIIITGDTSELRIC